MTKTIKEVAETFYPIDIQGNGWNEWDINEKERKGFVVGANVVLEEIEGIIANNEDNTLCMARCLVDKIKELKDE